MMRGRFILIIFAIGLASFSQSFCHAKTLEEAKSQPESTALEPEAGTDKAQTSDADSNKAGSRIKFEEMIHDFGQIDARTKHTCEFKFTNTGNSLLKITKIEPSCSACTVASLSRKEYSPGESGLIEVAYDDSSKRAGPAKYRVFVSSNDRINPEVTLFITAQVVMKVAYTPETLKLLFNQANAGCREITLTSKDHQPFAIKQFKSTNDCITANVDNSVEKASFVIKPKVNIQKLQDTLSGLIDIELTHPECNMVSIPFAAVPRFTTNPSVIVVLKAKPLELITREVWILNNYAEDFQVESTLSKNGIIKVLSQEMNGNRCKLELQITPPGGERRFFTDVFFVNIKNGDQLKIGCRGFYSRQ